MCVLGGGGGGLSPQCLKIAIVGEIYQIREELVGQEYVLIISNLMQVVISIMSLAFQSFQNFVGTIPPGSRIIGTRYLGLLDATHA